MAEVAQVAKSGEVCIQTSLHRSGVGVTLNVKAVDRVEGFFRDANPASPEPTPITQGRHWIPTGDKKLLAYELPEGIPPYFELPGGEVARLDRLGQPLYTANEGYVNISFLRLAGLSEGVGCAFKVRGVFTLEALQDLVDKIGKAQKKFYTSYLRPVDLVVMTCTQELLL